MAKKNFSKITCPNCNYDMSDIDKCFKYKINEKENEKNL